MELANCQSARQSNDLFWMKIKLSATINRTIRQTLQYPDFAQQYLNKQAQATQDDNIPTTSE